MQREKLESGLILHPMQIPRSLSFDYINYQADTALTVLTDLPMYGAIGIGGEPTKSKLLSALSNVEQHIQQLPEDADEDVNDIHLQGIQAQTVTSQAGGPESIPLETSMSHCAPTFECAQSKSHRQTALEVKHEIEVVLNQGYTRNLVLFILFNLHQTLSISSDDIFCCNLCIIRSWPCFKR